MAETERRKSENARFRKAIRDITEGSVLKQVKWIINQGLLCTEIFNYGAETINQMNLIKNSSSKRMHNGIVQESDLKKKLSGEGGSSPKKANGTLILMMTQPF